MNEDQHQHQHQQQQQQQQQEHLAVPPLQPNEQEHHRQCSSRLFGASSWLVGIVGGMVCLTAAAAAAAVIRQRRRHGRGKQQRAQGRHADGRIPLKDLIRFKERQWFVEELETARDGDPNAMVRLAKMYLHGQGCQRNIAMAQEWVRKARSMGMPSTLDELYATDDPEPRMKLRALAASEERRRSLRQLNAAAAAGHHTAAA